MTTQARSDATATLLGQTPSQTVGPFFSFGMAPARYGYRQMTSIAGGNLVDGAGQVEGERIIIEGVVIDGTGQAIPDALIEIWQADALGRYAHPADQRGSNAAFKGFGRCGTGSDPQCRFVFDTVLPGSVDGRQAPHINVIVFARGLLSHLFTRIYFADQEPANAADAVLQSVPAARRETLIARRPEGENGRLYRFDIHLQGPQETVFFDV